MNLEDNAEALAQTLRTAVPKCHTENTKETFYWSTRDNMNKPQRFSLFYFAFISQRKNSTMPIFLNAMWNKISISFIEPKWIKLFKSTNNLNNGRILEML